MKGYVKSEREKIKNERLNEEQLNNQGCLMRVVKYNTNKDIIVEFQDEYKAKVHTEYKHFINGNVKNPYYPSVYNVGIIGDKYFVKKNGIVAKEYRIWHNMLARCFDEKIKNKRPTYKDVACCDEWLLYENFYDWLHEQENFTKWLNGSKWALDKDILVKGNKLYSPETCCLVPIEINSLFTKRENCRGNLPIGVNSNGKKYVVVTSDGYHGICDTSQQAFQIYKNHKENSIKQAAQIEYEQGNITQKCYEAMIKYEVEITD